MRWKPLEKVKKRASLRLRPMNSSKHQPDLDMEAGISVSLPVSRTGSVKEVARTAPSKITENALGPLSSSGREESEEMDLADFLGMLDNSGTGVRHVLSLRSLTIACRNLAPLCYGSYNLCVCVCVCVCARTSTCVCLCYHGFG